MISPGQVTATDHGRYWPTPLWVIVFVDMPADPFAGYFDEADESRRERPWVCIREVACDWRLAEDFRPLAVYRGDLEMWKVRLGVRSPSG